jgi:hypothetical protein
MAWARDQIFLAAMLQQIAQHGYLRSLIVGDYGIGVLAMPELSFPAVQPASLPRQISGEVVHAPSHGLSIWDAQEQVNVVAEHDDGDDLHPRPLGSASEDGLGQLVEPTAGSEQEAGLLAPVGYQHHSTAWRDESNWFTHLTLKEGKDARDLSPFREKSNFSGWKHPGGPNC